MFVYKIVTTADGVSVYFVLALGLEKVIILLSPPCLFPVSVILHKFNCVDARHVLRCILNIHTIRISGCLNILSAEIA